MSPARASPRRVLTVLLVLCVVLTGCVGLLAEPAPPSGEAAADRYRAVDTVRATVVTVVENASGTTTRRAELVREPDTGRAWRRTVAPEADRGDLFVSNGSVTWFYDRSEGNVTHVDATAYERSDDAYAEYVGRLFAAVHAGENGDGAVGVSPLPVVPGPDRSARGVNGTVGPFVVSYEGTTAVGSRTAHVLELTPREGTGGEFAVRNRTLYLDTEHLYPLRQRTAYRVDGATTVRTVTHRNVSFGGRVPPTRFTFDPPTNATVEEYTLPESTAYDSLAALRANATMGLPSPTVPDGFALESARRTVSEERSYASVSLTYSDGRASVTVTKFNRSVPFGGTVGGGGETVRLEGRNATYHEYGVARSVGWTCPGTGTRYAASTDALSRTGLLDVARSVECGESDGDE